MLTARVVFLATFWAAGTAMAGASDLSWMAGHWCGQNRGTFNEEFWLPPLAGSLLGAHRDSRDGRLAGFEYFRVVEDGPDLVYHTQPGGRPSVAFRAASAAGNVVHFVNANHDFPKRITYRRIDSDTLFARIDDGSDTGKAMEWTWRRECRTAASR